MPPGIVRVGALIAILGAPAMAAAADLGAVPAPAPAQSGWIVTVGGEARVQPMFVGADNLAVYPYPLFSFRRVGTPPEFRSPRDGFSWALYDTGTFAIGPVAQLVWRRDQWNSSATYGLGDVNFALEVGVYAEYWFTRMFRIRGELRQGLGGHHGQVGDLAFDAVVPVSAQLTLSGGPRMRVASGSALEPYFSITPEQSVASGLPLYNAGTSIQSVGAGAQARYQWNQQWTQHFFVEYDRLLSDTANSPLVSMRGSDNQWTFGTGLTYSFVFKGF